MVCFFFNVTTPTEIYTLSLHDALPISKPGGMRRFAVIGVAVFIGVLVFAPSGLAASARVAALQVGLRAHGLDRKSTRLNSSHSQISYAVFCLKKKRQNRLNTAKR